MKNYIRSLDLLAAAAVFARKGRMNAAAKVFAAAVNDPSLTAGLTVIESSNKAAYANKAGAKVKANDSIDSKNPGEEFREEVAENGDRIVQEAAKLRAQARRLVQKADAMEDGEGDDNIDFLDGEDSTADADMDGDLDLGDEADDFGPGSASFVRAFGSPVKAAAAPKKIESAAFARALKNLNALGK